MGVVATDLECPTGTAWGYGGWDVQTGSWRKLLRCPGISAESLEAGEAGAAWRRAGTPRKSGQCGSPHSCCPQLFFYSEANASQF